MKSADANKQENPLLNIGINIILPTIILMKLSKEEYLGPFYGLMVAVAFPLGYGLYDLAINKNKNIFSLLGVISILLTGVIGLLALDAHWIAVKEASIPLLIGMAVIISMHTSYPLVEKLIYNEKLIDKVKIEAILAEKGLKKEFRLRLVQSSYMLAASFLLSSVLNYALAKIILVSQPGTEAFMEELGQMTALSFPVIAVPSTIIMGIALWYLIGSIKKLTGLELKEVFNPGLVE